MKKTLWLASFALLAILSCLGLAACGSGSLNELTTQTGITVEGGEFAKGATLSADVITDEGTLETIARALSDETYDRSAAMAVLDISVTLNGVAVQPNGTVTVTIPSPLLDVTEFLVFHVKESGSVERIIPLFANGKISFTTTSFSYFVIIDAASARHSFTAHVFGTGGTIMNGTSTVDGEIGSYASGEAITLTARANEGFRFTGWFEADPTVVTTVTLKEVPLSTEVTHVFTTGDADAVIYACFKGNVSSLFLDGANAGFTDGCATYMIGSSETTPNPEAVIVYAVAGEERTALTLGTDYTMDSGGLDFTKPATYVVTYTLSRDPSVTATLSVTVEMAQHEFKAYVFAGSGTISCQGESYPNGFVTSGAEGETVSLTAVPASGYLFTGWFEADPTVGTSVGLKDVALSVNATESFTIGKEDAVIYAVFTARITSLALDGANAGFTDGSATWILGSADTKPDPQAVLVKGQAGEEERILTLGTDYTIDNGGLDFTKPGTFVIIYAYSLDPTVVARLSVIVADAEYAFKALVGAGSGVIHCDGTPQPNGVQGLYKGDATIALSAYAADGYAFLGWYEPDETVVTALSFKETPVATEATHVFTMPSHDWTLYAVFTARVTALDLDGANAGFTDGSATWTIGSADTKPDPQAVIVSGVTCEGLVPFRLGTDYTIDASALDFTVAGTQVVTYVYGADPSVTASLRITIVLQTYTLSLLANPGGELTIAGLDGSVSFHVTTDIAGTTVTATAVALDGYAFVGWYEEALNDYTGVKPVATEATTSFTITAEEAGTYRYAVFAAVVTALSLDAANVGIPFVNGSATFTIGVDEATLAAVVVSGVTVEGSKVLATSEYTFADGGLALATPGVYTLTYAYAKTPAITATLTITVEYPTFIATAVVKGGGTVKANDGAGEASSCYSVVAPAGTVVTFTAIANDGYVFLGWFDADLADYAGISATATSGDLTVTILATNDGAMHYALFAPAVTALVLDAANVGILFTDGAADFLIGIDTIEIVNVVVSGLTIEGSKVLATSEYTFADGGLALATPGVYTLTYAYAKDATITATLTITVAYPKYDFTASVIGAGVISQPGDLLGSTLITRREEEGYCFSLIATPDEGVKFLGWYAEALSDYASATALSSAATTTFQVAANDEGTKVYAVFVIVTALVLDGANAGFATSGTTTYRIAGTAVTPDPQAVLVSGVTTLGNIPLVLDADYTLANGGFDATLAATYEITWTCLLNDSITATREVIVELPEFAFTGIDGLDEPFNGGTAAYVRKDTWTVNGVEIDDVTTLANVCFEWRDHDTGNPVSAFYDYTLDITLFDGPAPVGTYDFILQYTQGSAILDMATVTRIITQNRFVRASSRDDLDHEGLSVNAIVGLVGDDVYVMRTVGFTVAESVAIKVTPEADGSLLLGDEHAYTFRPYQFANAQRHYPRDSTDDADLLWDFRTGRGPYRAASINIWSGGFNIGVSGDSGIMVTFNEDATAEIYAPSLNTSQPGTTHHIRLVYDTKLAAYVFTAMDPDADTRTSYPIYAYAEYHAPAPVITTNSYLLCDTLDKTADGTPVEVNLYKTLLINKGMTSWDEVAKNGARMLWLDSDGKEVAGTSMDEMSAYGPSAAGTYTFVIQETSDGGKTYENMLEVAFTITAASA